MRIRIACVSVGLWVVFSLLPQAAAAEAIYTFVSSPDSWNADVGDVRSASGWDPGEPNSINASWRNAIDTVLTRFASHSPSFVLVPGDLVNGHWHTDVDGLGTFGSVATVAGKRRAIEEAAHLYYPQWRSQFAAHGLRFRPSLGDHELGNNPHGTNWDKRAVIPTFRRSWAGAFTYRNGRFAYSLHPRTGTQHAKTAYAFRRGPVFFVTVDLLHQDRQRMVHVDVVGAQLRWLRRVLTAANADPSVKFLVVQGHAPVLRPERAMGSGRLRVEGGSSSRFWQTLRRQGVDLYLAGEWHAISTANRGGVEQVVHGTMLGFGRAFNYLSVDVEAEQLRLALYRAPMTRRSDKRLWQVGRTKPFASRVVGDFSTVGTMTITADGQEVDRTGFFVR